jgi:hypothetical protein
MKRPITLTAIFTLTFFSASFAQKSAASKKIGFDYPDDIADTSKKTFVKDFDQGYMLYKITCSKCHTTTEKGKEIIPDFSLPQLMDYEIRIWPQHQEDIGNDARLADGELAKIVLFLRYKKRNVKQ